MRNVVIYCIIMLLGWLPALGQNYFKRVYNSGQSVNDGFICVTPTFRGGYCAAGSSNDNPLTTLFVLNVDSIGDTLWQRNIELSVNGGEGGYEIVQTIDSGFVITGGVFDSLETAQDVYLIKLDVSGNTEWYTEHDGGFNDKALEMVRTQDGGFVVAGELLDTVTLFPDLFLMKFDSAGSFLWQQDYGTISSDYVQGLIETPDNGFMLVGQYANVDSSNWDGFVLKTDSTGTQEWWQGYDSGTNVHDIMNGVIALPSSGYLLIGAKEKTGGIDSEGWVVKIDNQGGMLWDKVFGFNYTFYALSHIEQLTNGNYLVPGAYYNGVSSQKVMALVIDEWADSLWSRQYWHYPSPWDTYAYDVEATTDGGFVMAGFVINNTTGTGNDGWLMKVDSCGCEVAGCVVSCATTDVVMNRNTERYEVVIYPNPATDRVTIEFEGIGDLTIRDAMGRLVVSEKGVGGRYTLNTGNFAEGVYFMEVEQYNGVWNGKLIKKQ